MARVPQATSKTWHKIHIALVNQPKNLDGTLRPASPIGRKVVSFSLSWIRLGHLQPPIKMWASLAAFTAGQRLPQRPTTLGYAIL
jgi:hypothetical protein